MWIFQRELTYVGQK